MTSFPPDHFDLLTLAGPRRDVLDHGWVELVDCMPRVVPVGRTGDISPVQAARVSLNQDLKTPDDDKKLIWYLMRCAHTTPFEMPRLQFRVHVPMFIARQWMRHRTGSFNEWSARYMELPLKFHVPEVWRAQGTKNKQGSEGVVKYRPIHDINFLSIIEYHRRLNSGVSREQARICLPLSTYTQFMWGIDLHNLMGFMFLRMDEHAQEEIRVYAEALHALVAPMFPETIAAFNRLSNVKRFVRDNFEVVESLKEGVV